jgi:hypothetical protein
VSFDLEQLGNQDPIVHFCHLLRHCLFVRHEISEAISSPCVCTKSFRLMSSFSVHLHPTSRCPFIPVLQHFSPPVTTLNFRSARNQFGNSGSILAIVQLHRFPQLAVFDCCPHTKTSCRRVAAGIQGISPPVITLHFRSTRHQCGYCGPILAIVLWHEFPQLAVFD